MKYFNSATFHSGTFNGPGADEMGRQEKRAVARFSRVLPAVGRGGRAQPAAGRGDRLRGPAGR